MWVDSSLVHLRYVLNFNLVFTTMPTAVWAASISGQNVNELSPYADNMVFRCVTAFHYLLLAAGKQVMAEHDTLWFI